jgi:hypothetical protein
MKCSLKHETLLRAQGHNIIAGIDEAGRGPLAARSWLVPQSFRRNFGTRFFATRSCSPRRNASESMNELTRRQDVVWSVAVVTTETSID